VNHKLRDIVASKLILDWSPEQISGWLKTHYPNNESMRVSQEAIYRSLFIQVRGALKKELMDHLRSKRSVGPTKIRICCCGNIFREELTCLPSLKRGSTSLAALESTSKKNPRIPDSCE